MTRRPPLPDPETATACQVFRAEDIRAICGTFAGDRLATGDAVCPGDVYALSEGDRILPRDHGAQAIR